MLDTETNSWNKRGKASSGCFRGRRAVRMFGPTFKSEEIMAVQFCANFKGNLILMSVGVLMLWFGNRAVSQTYNEKCCVPAFTAENVEACITPCLASATCNGTGSDGYFQGQCFQWRPLTHCTTGTVTNLWVDFWECDERSCPTGFECYQKTLGAELVEDIPECSGTPCPD